MSSSPALTLPSSHRALYLSSTSSPLVVRTLPTPQPTPGSAIVQVLTASLLSYSRLIYNGTLQYPFPTPLIPGASAIGRIAALGSDATRLKINDLVHIDVVIRGRDDPSAIMLSGIIEGDTEGAKALMRGEWRDGTYAEYAKVPLESCTVLNESKLCGPDPGMGYDIKALSLISVPLVPYGGLRDAGLQAGETVLIAPATGNFGQAAVRVAVAMGANVVAAGRNKSKLESLARANHGRVVSVAMSGNVEDDTQALKSHGPIDVYLDISPPEAAQSKHIKSGILALGQGARVSLMGGIRGDVGIPYPWVMRNSIALKGRYMFEKEDIRLLVKMVEKGIFDLREGQSVKGFGLEAWDEAFTAAAEMGAGDCVVLTP